MDEPSERSESVDNGSPESNSETRPQQGGEAPTTRFGMEDGDNTDIVSPTPTESED